MSADVAEIVFYTEDSASPLTVLKPAAFAAGQLLLFVLGQDAGSALADLTGPAGWTDQGNYSQASSQGRVWSHVFTSGDPASWDFGYNAGADVAGALLRITGADTTPVVVVTTQSNGPTGGAINGTSVTPTGVNDLLVDVLCVVAGGTALVETDPPGSTDRGQGQVTGNFQAIAVASTQLSSGSATGTRAWTSITPASKPGGTFTVAVKSATGGGAAADAGTARLALSGRAVAVKVARQSGTATLALRGTGVEQTSTTRAQTGTARVALSGMAAAARRALPVGRGLLVLRGTGGALHRAVGAGTGVVALSGTGTARKTATGAGRAVLALTGAGVESVGVGRPQTGSAGLALTGVGAAARRALPAGQAVLALTGTSTPLRRATTVAGRALVAVTGSGAAARRASTTGRALLVLLPYQGPPAPPANPPGADFTTTADRGLLAMLTADSGASWTTRDSTGPRMSSGSSRGGPGQGRDRPST